MSDYEAAKKTAIKAQKAEGGDLPPDFRAGWIAGFEAGWNATNPEPTGADS